MSVLEGIACPHCGQKSLEMVSYPIGFYCKSCGGNTDQETLVASFSRGATINYQPDSFRLDPNLIHGFGQRIEISDEQRKGFYLKSLIIDSIVYTIFFVCLSFFFPLNNISWRLLIGIFIVSRLFDLFSTVIGLALGATETNPASDPYSISKIIPFQVAQVIGVVFVSFLLGLISVWLKVGFLFVFSLIGFHAFFANLGQVFSGPASNVSATTGKFYTAQVISFILVIVIVSVIASIYF